MKLTRVLLMTRLTKIFRFGLAIAALGVLGACTVVPVQPTGYYRAPPVYVETYPAYAPPRGTIYYDSGYRHYDDRASRYYDDRRHERRYGAPLPPPLQLHRDVRRSLGLPRLPGMP